VPELSSPSRSAVAHDHMQIAILESDLRALDSALETLSSAGHICFGVVSDQSLHELLGQVSIDLVILDWVVPDLVRYDTLRYLSKYRSATPIILSVTPRTSENVIASGLQGGAKICLDKPLSTSESLAHIRALEPQRSSCASCATS
jgi:DNA-binding response OmpR family regulator